MVGLSGCYRLGQVGSEVAGMSSFYGNAYTVTSDSPPQEAVDNLSSFFERQNIQLESVDNNTIKTKPKTMSNNNELGAGSQQTIRMKAVAEPTDNGSEIVVIAEYQAGATGEWSRAKAESGGDVTTPPGQAFKKLRNLLRQAYGEDSIEDTDADMNY